ncbi:MAG TPA: hypothetical protein VM408_00360 [Methylomirabilota bacterium]|nr:hypothetical protein [Methylomirabilota bacterium]
MHVQARASTAKSPADLAAFLKELAPNALDGRKAINVEGVAGSAIEAGGLFVFAVEDGQEGEADDRLRGNGYTCEWTTDLYHEEIPRPHVASDPAQAAPPDPNQPGVLLGIIERARESRPSGAAIDSVLIGAFTNRSNRFFAQVTFEDSTWNAARPGPHPPER